MQNELFYPEGQRSELSHTGAMFNLRNKMCLVQQIIYTYMAFLIDVK